jgi:hypothetical protein
MGNFVTERDDSITANSVTSQQLLQAVKGFIAETVTPALSDRNQFNARVAANGSPTERPIRILCRKYPKPLLNERLSRTQRFLITSSSVNSCSAPSTTHGMRIAPQRLKNGAI